MNVIVSGSAGQLGIEFQELLSNNAGYTVHFFDSKSLDISDKEAITDVFKQIKPDIFINCAAYTQVDLAESEEEKCLSINAYSLESIVENCRLNSCLLIHFSSDYVFDGTKEGFYNESDQTQSINIYGASKLIGESIVEEQCENYCIIRTSWLYSSHGINFVNTMIRLGSERDELQIIDDQIGCPTWTFELAKTVVKIADKFRLESDSFPSGIYHFTHEGFCSWKEFAEEIFKQKNIVCSVLPTTTEQYNSPAKRPLNSKLDCTKIKNTFDIQTFSWQEALRACLKKNN